MAAALLPSSPHCAAAAWAECPATAPPPPQPKVVVLLIGINDMHSLVGTELVSQRLSGRQSGSHPLWPAGELGCHPVGTSASACPRVCTAHSRMLYNILLLAPRIVGCGVQVRRPHVRPLPAPGDDLLTSLPHLPQGARSCAPAAPAAAPLPHCAAGPAAGWHLGDPTLCQPPVAFTVHQGAAARE